MARRARVTCQRGEGHGFCGSHRFSSWTTMSHRLQTMQIRIKTTLFAPTLVLALILDLLYRTNCSLETNVRSARPLLLAWQTNKQDSISLAWDHPAMGTAGSLRDLAQIINLFSSELAFPQGWLTCDAGINVWKFDFFSLLFQVLSPSSLT